MADTILTSQEFDRRMKAAQEVVRKNGLDAILVFSTRSEEHTSEL